MPPAHDLPGCGRRRTRSSGTSTPPLIAILAFLVVPAAAAAQDAETYFRQNCTSCHTIGGGRLTGPDLEDVTSRQDPAWLAPFIENPQRVIDSGDPYAAQLVREARGVVMPRPPGITPDLAGALLALIESESALEVSQFRGLQVSDRPFTLADVSLGRALFTGHTALAGSEASCLSCHTTRGLGTLGGGRLGPDLTTVYERLQGRTGVGSWLTTPPTPTMQSMFAGSPLEPDEVLALVAFFESEAEAGGEDASPSALVFLLLGFGGTAVALVGFEAGWHKRFRAVRRPLVHRPRTR